ncbi:MAG TPA: lysophospholipid acyltransferase family protein [Thermoanaerobaculia bacterium]|nr:lysophospholipid acyltransferase family protein [Thermoanaerobaculia bacterium]
MPIDTLQNVLRAELPGMPRLSRRIALKTVLGAFGGLVTVEGAERLAAGPEPAIFALNHNTTFESLLVPCALLYLRGGRPLHFLVDWMYLHLPLLGWVIRQCDPIPVYRKPSRFRLREVYRVSRAKEPVLDLCLARLAAGGSLGIFPEGTRNADPERLLRGRSGVGELVLRSAAPVVPVGIHYPAWARLGRAPRLGRLVLRVGEPLDFVAEREEALAAPAGRARREVARRAVSRVMASLEELSGKTRWSNEPFRRFEPAGDRP